MNFENDIEKTKDKLAALDQKALPRAIAQAINRVGAKVMSRSITRTAKDINVPKKLIKGRARLEKAKTSRLSAFIKVNRSNLPVIRLVSGKSNVFVRKGKNRGQLKIGQRLYERAFIQKLANGRTQVLQRQGKDRYPIDVAKIPLLNPLTEAFEIEVKQVYKTDMPKELQSALNHQIKLVVKNK